jgi:hypothetical protein
MPRLQWTLRFSLVGLLRTASLLACLCLPAGAVVARDNAAIYFYGPPPSVERIVAAAPGATTEARLEGDRTRITVAWPDVTLVITVDPAWNRDVQLLGMRNWIGQFGPVHRNTPSAKALLANLDRTTTCYGSVITPAFDAEGKVAAALLRLLKPEGGFFFAHQSLYDSTGSKIMGMPGDPQRLGPRHTPAQP